MSDMELKPGRSYLVDSDGAHELPDTEVEQLKGFANFVEAIQTDESRKVLRGVYSIIDNIEVALASEPSASAIITLRAVKMSILLGYPEDCDA